MTPELCRELSEVEPEKFRVDSYAWHFMFKHGDAWLSLRNVSADAFVYCLSQMPHALSGYSESEEVYFCAYGDYRGTGEDRATACFKCFVEMRRGS